MEIKINDGDFIFVKKYISTSELLSPIGWRLEVFQGIEKGHILTTMKYYPCFVPFDKFNPYDMEKTVKELIRVKNGALCKKYE